MSCINDQNQIITTDFVVSYWHITIIHRGTTRIRNRFSVATFGPNSEVIGPRSGHFIVCPEITALWFFVSTSISKRYKTGLDGVSSIFVTNDNIGILHRIHSYTSFIIERDNFYLNNGINLIHLRQMVYERKNHIMAKINIRFWIRRVIGLATVCRFFGARITSKNGLRVTNVTTRDYNIMLWERWIAACLLLPNFEQNN